MREAAARFASQLRSNGVSSGQPVAALVTSGPAAVAQMFGTWLFGSPYIPLNARLSNGEVLHLLGDTRPAVLVHQPGRDPIEQPHWATMIETADLAWDFHDAPDGQGGPYADYPAGVAIVLRTSGTTGRPKAVVHTHMSMLKSLDTVIGTIRRNASSASRDSAESATSTNLIPVSLALSAGIYNTLFAFRVSAAVVLMDRFSTTETVWAVQTFGIRSTVLAPAMISMLADDRSIASLEPLKVVRSITAPLRPSDARRFHDRFGVAVLNSYGQTELGGEVVGWTAQDWRQYRTTKLGAVGRAHDGVDLQVKDASGRLLGPGETGDVFVRSPYFIDDLANDESLRDRIENGYVRTGDIGHLDEDDFLWIDGRESDMINRGGLKVMPDEVEEVLRQHPAVRDACVAGIPDQRLGEVPHAWVVLDEPAIDPAVLASWCREQLSPYKVPVGFSVIREVPRSEVGKVLRQELVQARSNGE